MAKDIVKDSPDLGDHTDILQAGSESSLALPDVAFITDARFIKDGQDLVLQTDNGETVIVEDYFSSFPPPVLTAPSGAVLTPDMVNAFTAYSGPVQYAQAGTMNDASPVGLVREIDGSATVTHPDGSTQPLTLGSAIFQGDIIETADGSGVELLFLDDSTFAISENARLAIDDYVFDPVTEDGASNFSLLRGVFIYTSGLIGRSDPDDVEIDTPVGSIGIRGTIIAGAINPDGESYVTVTEGAIVITNNTGALTLAEQFQTVILTGYDAPITLTELLTLEDLFNLYSSLEPVSQSFQTDFGSGYNIPETMPFNIQVEPEAGEEEATSDIEETSINPYVLAPTLSFEGTNSFISDPAVTTEPAPATNETTPQSLTVGDNTFAVSITDTQVPLLPPLELEAITSGINENATAGDLIAVIKTTVDYPLVRFALLNVPVDSAGDPLFSMTQVAPNQVAIHLTTAGASEIDAGEHFSFDIRASLPDGRTITRSADLEITSPPPEPLLLNTISGTDGFTVAGTGGEKLGYEIAAWGDVNGDGFDDILIANHQATGGSIYRLSGSTMTSEATLPGSPSLDPVIAGIGDFDGDGQLDFIIGAPLSNSSITGGGSAGLKSLYSPVFTGQTADAALGQSVAGIGDVNGDGLMDILVGAPGTNADSGTAYVVFGSSTLTSDIKINDANLNSIPEFQDSGFGFAIEGINIGGSLGMTVSSAGDFNKDGYADYLIAEPGQNRVHLAFGGQNQGDVTLGTDTITIMNIAVDSNNLPVFNMGDMNGDGISDIAIHATGTNTDADAAMEGTFYVIYGNAGATGGQVIDVSNLTSSQGFKVGVTDPGKTIVDAGYAGDFNGDGYDDGVIVFRDGSVADIHVVYGRPGSPGTLTDADLLNPANGFYMQYDLSFLANPETDPFHFDISTAGDVNGDGFADLAIGTPDASSGDGGVTIVYGRNETATGTDGQQVHIAGQTTPLSDVIANGNGQHLIGDSGINELNDNGFTGITMRGGAGNDIFKLSGTARSIDGGTGFDTVQLLGPTSALDYSNVGSEALSGIERFQMSENGQSIKLGLDDIFRLLQESSDGALRIEDTSFGGITSFVVDDNGGSGTVFSSAASGTVTEAGVTYDVYNFNSYQLMIDQNVDNVTVA